MRKLLRSRKALSPVIAAIILIAVTVAVSIAVAAWMGALTFTFMGTENLSFRNILWDATGYAWVKITVKNTGTASLTISSVKINNYLNDTAPGWKKTDDTGSPLPITMNPNEEVVIYIYANAYPTSAGITSADKFAQGATYAFTVTTAKNNPFGPYTASAPS